MAVLTVGSGLQYSTIAAAVAASHDGDVVQVQAGTYTNDFATVATKITLEGVGGMVHMLATEAPPNGKAILTTNTDVTVDHFEFSGAAVPDMNGSGIRYQGGNLTISNSYFHDNQEGLLANPDLSGSITIKRSEFAHNGAGDGYSHNLYVGDVGNLTISDSYFHDAVVGHEIKSRAETTSITNTRVFDNQGSASYSINLPNGGHAVLTGNTIQQGPNSENAHIITYGEEGNLHTTAGLTLSDNTVLNDSPSPSANLLWNATSSVASISDTKVYGLTDEQLTSGPAAVSGTTHLSGEPVLDTSHPWVTTADPDPVPTPEPEPEPAPPPPAGLTKVGTKHADFLSGGEGSDTLDGGAGNDILLGGPGGDLFIMSRHAGHDTIVDFDAAPAGGQDHIDLTALGVTAENFGNMVRISDHHGNAVVSIGHARVELLGVQTSSLGASDFILG